MRLVPKEFEEFNPVVLLFGAGFLVAGGYPLLMMPGPLILSLPLRVPFGATSAAGLVILISQFQSWRHDRSK